MIQIPPVLKMIEKLIAIPSISCVNPRLDQSNQAIIEQLANWCADVGFESEIFPIPERPDKFNLLATLGKGEGGLVLAGHTDTVPYDEHRWQTDPFQLTQKDNRLYGLGTTDMKTFFALALTAAAQFKADNLRHPLLLLATADEESGMCGARAFAHLGRPNARYALLGEPTDLKPVRMHKGILMEAVKIIGTGGHSSRPYLGNSALEGIHKVISALLAWRSKLQQEYVNPLFDIPTPTLNFGYIHGGDNPNRICAECELHIDVRLLPGMTVTETRHLFQQQVLESIAGSGLRAQFTALFEGMNAMETSAEAEIVHIAERLSGHSAEIATYATEAPYFQTLGMQTVVLGPGRIEQAHQPNEFINLDFLQPTLDILIPLIQHFCVEN